MTAGDIAGERAEVTRLLSAWRSGDEAARDQVVEAVYAQVRLLAARHLRGQSGAGAVSLQPTELANELFIRLLGSDCTWSDRRHFYNAAALAMRRILVDAARARNSAKRGSGRVHLTLSAAEQQPLPETEIDQLDGALEALRQLDPRKADVVEMCYLLGLDREAIASALAVSVATVDRDLRFARAWLQQRLVA